MVDTTTVHRRHCNNVIFIHDDDDDDDVGWPRGYSDHFVTMSVFLGGWMCVLAR